MSEYIVSARKYRPMTFDSVVGQSALTTTLKNAVQSGKLAHAYLFCGPRGVGKTTCARIFAKVINCLKPTDTGDACGECESCKAFNEGRSLNIFELDAASNNSVDSIKNLMEQTHIPPQTGRYKVFIIDEVHMLSTAAFNAFLKTLEEPPSHVIFILATTEKHKILPTIISRCQIYDFERMSVSGIINHLKHVADSEGIKYEEEALNVIAEKADGGMRDALSIFDQAASFCQGNITFQKVIEDLNVLDADNYFKIIDLALENKVSDIMLIVNSILSKGFDGGQMINGLASHVRNVLMAQTPQTTQLIEASETQRQKYAEQAKHCAEHSTKGNFLYSTLRLLNQCDLSYRQSSNKRLLVELTLIQVAQLTLPAEDDPSAGRRPCKRLKSLFKKIMKQAQQQAASQVAAAASASAPSNTAAQQSSATQNTSNQSIAVSNGKGQSAPTGVISNRDASSTKTGGTDVLQPTVPKTPKVKLSSLGTSFGTILNGPAKRNDQVAPTLGETAKESQTFTDDDLRREWLSMCNRMMQSRQFNALAQRMRNIQVKVKAFPQVEAIAENTMLLNDVHAILPRIQVTLAKYLHNGALTLTMRLAEQKEIQHRLSPKEFMEKLVKTNKAFADFHKAMKLEVEL